MVESNTPAPVSNPLVEQPVLGGDSNQRTLPSGRAIVLHVRDGTEEIEIRSVDGKPELRIALTDQGPVLTLEGARFEIASTDTVAVNCARFEVNATDAVQLHAAGNIDVRSDADINVKSARDTYIDGDYVQLNCLDRTGYHDHEPNQNQSDTTETPPEALNDPDPSEENPQDG